MWLNLHEIILEGKTPYDDLIKIAAFMHKQQESLEYEILEQDNNPILVNLKPDGSDQTYNIIAYSNSNAPISYILVK